ncbi:MAG TPA: zincin-like metallopeptidase domain-containing protein [Cytophagales bacterium]|nr:zincin-like metallopeptidase domain-containing protein [Cytophagales bacterium]
MTAKQKSKNVYEIVSEHITSILSSGIIPWRMPWSDGRVPTNLITRNPYRGINVFLLAAQYYRCNLFLSEAQLINVGGEPGELNAPTIAVHWEWVDKQAKEGEPKPESKYPLLRYHKVYNVEDCDGINHDMLPGYDRPSKPFEAAREIIKNMPDAPKIEYYKTAASYVSNSDIVFMPNSEEYGAKELYYYDLFKLLVHSTAHEKRLNRKQAEDTGAHFTIDTLIVDMAAHYLCYHSGMNKVPLMNNLQYIHGWIEAFSKNSRMVVSAAVHAQKAVDYILNLKSKSTEGATDPREMNESEEPDAEETEEPGEDEETSH